MSIGTLTVLIIIIFGLVVLSLNKCLPKCRWFCDRLGWHLEPHPKYFVGCNINGTCPRCGKKVLQDSQGNWF